MPKLTDPHYTYTPENSPRFTFVWTAGPYIDVLDNDTHKTVDCINVWDYERDRPNMPVTLDDFRETCDQYLIDLFYDDLDFL